MRNPTDVYLDNVPAFSWIGVILFCCIIVLTLVVYTHGHRLKVMERKLSYFQQLSGIYVAQLKKAGVPDTDIPKPEG